MTTPPIGRRAQNRATRHAQLMAAATEIIATKGLSGLTMQAVAELVDCAVGTIYTYFPSKTALLSELQIAAIRTLQATFDASLASWDDELARLDIDDDLAALVRLVAFGHLFTAGPDLHPREFELLQALISTPNLETGDDGPDVLPHALALINEFRLLIDRAVELDVLECGTGGAEGNDPLEVSMARTLRWAGGLNGALLVSNAHPDERLLLDGRSLALQLSHDLLRGWGADAEQLRAATDVVAGLALRQRLLVRAEPPVTISETAPV